MAVPGLLMLAGKLDRKVVLRRVIEGISATTHATTLTPQDITGPISAGKLPVRGDEKFAEDQPQAWAYVTWQIRYFRYGLDDPTVKLELLEGTRVYQVLAVREIARREGWELDTRCRAEDQAA